MNELHGSITDEEKTFIETWENVGEGTNYIITENRRGDEVQVGIAGPRTFRLSTYERMLTEDKVVDPRHNPFKNGTFRPVTVPETVTIESNPNALSSEDILRLFTSSDVAWAEYLLVIDAPATLKRMMDMAENSDITMRRYRQLEEAYAKHSSVGSRITSSKDPDIQRQIDSLPGGAPTGTPMRARATSGATAR